MGALFDFTQEFPAALDFFARSVYNILICYPVLNKILFLAILSILNRKVQHIVPLQMGNIQCQEKKS